MTTCLLGTWAYFMHTIINYQYNDILYRRINWLAWYITKYCISILRSIVVFFNLNNELCILSTDVTITFLLIKDNFYRTVSGMNWTSYLYISKLSIYWYLKYLIVEPKINNYKYNKRWYTYSSHHFNRQDYFMIISWLEYNYM